MSLPQFHPMPLASLAMPFDHPDWIFELKYDGFRALAHVDAAGCRLVSRNGNTFKSFGDLCSAIAEAVPHQAILDGEIVHLDRTGRPQFYNLLRRRSPQQFVAFDILWLDGRDLRGLPLLERKRLLRRVVLAGGPVLYADYVRERGVDLFQAVCDERASSRSSPRGCIRRKRPLGSRSRTGAQSAVGRHELFERRRDYAIEIRIDGVKTKTAGLVLPEGTGKGSILTLTYDRPDFGPTPYHGIVLRLARSKKRLYVLFIYSSEEPPEYSVIDLKTGIDPGCGWRVLRAELCDVDDIREIINDPGYYDKGEPPTVSGGRPESSRRRH